MKIFEEIKNNSDDFERFCRENHVVTMYAFGSSTNSTFDQQSSDIDVMVKVDIQDPVERGESLLSLWNALESLFKRKVDLITESSLRNPYLKNSIDATKVLIYDGSRQKISA